MKMTMYEEIGCNCDLLPFTINFFEQWTLGNGEKVALKDCTPASIIAVTDVTLSKSTLSLVEEGTATLTATVSPEDATDKTVAWSTSDANVATVNDGTVTAIAAGNATITVTTTDGSFTATCAVTVTAKDQS